MNHKTCRRGSLLCLRVFALAGALTCAQAWAINKCTGADGKVVFQDAPCAGRGEVLNVRPASGHANMARPADVGAPQAAQPATPAAKRKAPLARAGSGAHTWKTGASPMRKRQVIGTSRIAKKSWPTCGLSRAAPITTWLALPFYSRWRPRCRPPRRCATFGRAS